jgi:hypothetical protein
MERKNKGSRPCAGNCRGRREAGRVASLMLAVVRGREKEEGLPALRWHLSRKERSRKGCQACASSCQGTREGGRVAGLALVFVGEGEKQEGLSALR